MIESNVGSIEYLLLLSDVLGWCSMKAENFVFLNESGFFLLQIACFFLILSLYSTMHFAFGSMLCDEWQISVARLVSSISSSTLISRTSSFSSLSNIHFELVRMSCWPQIMSAPIIIG